ncbi:ARM repeat domain-containing protein [Chloropicon primus]|nr:ARM repeat domain-containing protein [Chloropicon primus]
MTEEAGSWNELVADVCSISTKRRVGAWEKIASRESGDVSPENAIVAIENAIGPYSDKQSKLAVVKAIDAWMGSEDFVKLSVVSIAKRKKEIERYAFSPHERYVLLSWVCSLIGKLRESKQVKAENAMIALGAHLLTAAMMDAGIGKPKVWFAHKQVVNATVFAGASGESFDALAEHFLQESKEPGLLRFLAERKEIQQHTSTEVRAKLVSIFIESAITAKTKPTDKDIEACLPLLASLSKEEFGSQVMPGVQRMMKRSPEVIIPTLISLIPKLKISLSEWMTDLLGCFVAQLQSSNQGHRDDASRAAQALCESIADSSYVEEVTKYFVELITSKKLKQWYERQQVVTILRSLCEMALQLRLPAGYFTAYTRNLFEVYKKESNETVKEAILCSVASCVDHIDSVGSGDIDPLGVLLSGKSDLKSPALDILVGLSENRQVPTSVLMGLQGKVLALLKDSIAKSASRPFFSGAMLFLINLSKKEASVRETMKTEGISEKLVAESKPLFCESQASLTDQQSKNMASTCRDLLLGQSDVEISAIIPDLCMQLVLLALKKSRRVQKHVLDVMKQINGASTELAFSLLSALHDLVSECRHDSDFDTQEMRSRATKCMIALAGFDISREIIVRILLLSHHPYFMKEAGTSFAWPHFMSHCKSSLKQRSDGASAEDLINENMQGILEGLLGEKGLRNESVDEIEAAINGVAELSTLSCGSFMENLLPAISAIDDFDTHSTLKESDFKVYFTPEGELADEYGTYRGEVVQSKNVRRAKGRFKSGSGAFGDLSDDDDYVPQRRETKQKESKGKAKPKGKQAVDPREKARREQLSKESQIREKLQVIRENISSVLQIINGMAKLAPKLVLDNLGSLATISTPLLGSMLLHSEAFETTQALAKCLPSPLDKKAGDLANCLWLILGPESHDTISSVKLQDSIDVISDACRAGPIYAPVYWFLFPILKCVFSYDKITPMHEEVVRTLLLHTIADGDWPFGMTAEAFFTLWSLVPSHRADLEAGLNNICMRFTKGADLLLIANGLFKDDVNIRLVTCTCLQKSPLWPSKKIPASERISIPFWIALHDPDERVAASAETLWKLYSHGLPVNFIGGMIPYLNHPNLNTVEAAAAALGEAVEEYPDTAEAVVGTLVNSFEGMGIQGRIGIGMALKECSSVVAYDTIRETIDFLLLTGLTDVDEKVRESVLNAGIAVVNNFGDDHSVELLDIFESRMNSSAAKLGLHSEEAYDMIKQGLVILLGALACHFDSSNENVKLILEQLIGALDTPSEIVQRSVSERLPPLIKILSKDKEEMKRMVSRQLEYLEEAQNYGKRKGAAYGLAGIVKGLGMAALKNYDVINVLKSYVEDKKNQEAREGALMGFACLSERLGRLFEPYIIHILPLLLLAMGDGVIPVRQAAEEASHVIMGKLSTQGMRLVLPVLLKGLDEIQWRTKQGSVQLLGAMAYCAPKHLGTCLPTIVPKIGEVLKDPHPRVQEAAKNALSEIGSVIRNPEISQISGQLLSALADPANTKKALESLLTTRFINTIDAASLSLIMPILMHGLQERSKTNKKKAAQIVGSLCQLVTDSKDMSSYMDDIILSLKKVLVDPIPEVRYASAKAIGSLVRGIGPTAVQELLPWFLETLKSDSTSVEKNGAAQALSEVLAVLGTNHLDELMPEIISGCAQNVNMQEGYLTMFKYLPFAMESAFQGYLHDILPIVIPALSNDVEGVRDAAFNSAKAIIEIYATTSTALLLPVIEKGILDPTWRIRESSVDLLGRLIFKLSGKSLQKTSDDEEILSFTEKQTQHMMDTIGEEQWQKILSLLYLLRSDGAYTVRNNALNIWKIVVSNTPRTLIRIVSPLMRLVIDALSEHGSDQQQTAASCLGELVRKFGERITKLIFPIMEEGLQDGSTSARRGVCYGLSAVLKNVSKQQIVAVLPTLLPAVQSALCDDDESVRIASGELMATLFKGAGDIIQENVLPQILLDINDNRGNAERSLEGLVVMMGVRPTILDAVLPEVITLPLTPIKAKSLGEIAKAIPPASVHKQLKSFLKPLLSTLTTAEVDETHEAAESAVESIISCIEDDALYDFTSVLVREFDDPKSCLGSAKVVQSFCRTTKLDYQEMVDQLLASIISVFADAEGECLQECWNALNTVVKSIPKESQASHVPSLKDAIKAAREHEKRKRHGGELLVAGFCKPPKALSAALPIYLSGLLTAKSSEIREKAAEGLGELIEVTSLPSLKPALAQITGPLIRILGDRYPWQVKLAILSSIQSLLKKAGLFLKPFVPQLQTTFLKSLNDAASEVREKAAENLGFLAQLTLRIDQLVKDLLNTIRTCSPSVKEACITALGGVVYNGPKAKLSAAVITQSGEDLRGLVTDDEESSDVQRRAAFALGQFGARCSGEELKSLLSSVGGEPSERNMITFNSLLEHALDKLQGAGVFPNCLQLIQQWSKSKDQDVKAKAGEACGIILLKESAGEALPSLRSLSPCIPKLLDPENNSEVLIKTMDGLTKVADKDFGLLDPAFASDLLQLLSNLLEVQSSGPAKMATEDLVGSCLGIAAGAEKAFDNLNGLAQVAPAVKHQVNLALLKKVATRRNNK